MRLITYLFHLATSSTRNKIITSILLSGVFFGVLFLLQPPIKKSPIMPNLTALPTPNVGILSPDGQSSKTFLNRLVFYKIPTEENLLSLGWASSTPIYATSYAIKEAVTNQAVLLFPSKVSTNFSGLGRGFITENAKLNLYTFPRDLKSLPSNYSQYLKLFTTSDPNTIIALNKDSKTFILINILDNSITALYTHNSVINPNTLNGSQANLLSFADKTGINVLDLTLKKIINRLDLDNPSYPNTLFWLSNNLFLVQKDITDRNQLDRIYQVDFTNKNLIHVLTDAPMINRLDLSITPSTNSEGDLVLFSERNGTAWILSLDNAISRFFPELGVPQFANDEDTL